MQKTARDLAREVVALELLGPGTIDQKARRAGVSRSTIYRLLRSADFRRKLAGLQRQVRREAIDIVAERSVQTDDPQPAAAAATEREP